MATSEEVGTGSHLDRKRSPGEHPWAEGVVILVSLTAPQALAFSSDAPKMISTAQDAVAVVDIGEDEDDVLNEVCFSRL